MASTRDQSFDHNMSFGDHLEELRMRLLLALAVPLPITIIAFFFSDTLISWLLLPLFRVLRAHGLPQQVQNIGPAEMIMTQLKLSMIAGVIVAAPWVLWQAWKFISPGLYPHEKRFVRVLLPGSGVLTVIGVLLMYFAMLPLMLYMLVAFGSSVVVKMPQPDLDPRVQQALETNTSLALRYAPPAEPAAGEAWLLWPDLKLFVAAGNDDGSVEVIHVPQPSDGSVVQQYRLSEYISFVLLMFLAITIAFQTPLVVLLLGWLGLASADWLKKNRPYALGICGVVAAVITPPDALSMIMMLIPLYGLYELGIILLVFAPASAVADGRLLRMRWPGNRSDKRRQTPDNRSSAAQMELTVSRRQRESDNGSEKADQEEHTP